MAATGIPVYIPAVAANGTVASSFKVNGWVPTSAGAPTATRRTFYTDAELTTPAANPATLGASGRVFYVNPALSYAFTITDAAEAVTYDTIYMPAELDAAGAAVLTPLVVSNNAALTALTAGTGLVDNGLYQTLGRTTENDGGQGQWLYDSASTSTADGGTILAINGGGAGRFFRLGSLSRQDARWFGVIAGSGASASANYTAVEAWMTNTATVGKELILPAADIWKFSRAIRMRSERSLIVEGPDTVVSIVGTGFQWPAYGCIILGYGCFPNHRQGTSYALNALTTGSNSITTTTAAHAGNFQAGDVCVVESVRTFNNGFEDISTFQQFNVIQTATVGTGVITLRHGSDVGTPDGVLTNPALAIGSTTTNVATGAFDYIIGGTVYSKAAVAVGTAPGNDIIPTGKYGAVALDIGTDGTIDVIEAANNASGYYTASEAVAGLAAPAANHIRIGTVTATKSDGSFTFGTTALNAANTTVAYTNSYGTRYVIRNLSRTGITAIFADGVTPDTGQTIEAVRDVKVLGGHWVAETAQSPFIGDGYAIDSVFDVISVTAARGVGYGNSFANCIHRAQWQIVTHALVELGYGSSANFVEIGDVTVIPGYTTTALAGVTEGGRANRINIRKIDCFNNTVDHGVWLDASPDNTIEIGYLSANQIEFDPVRIITPSYTGYAPRSERNHVHIQYCNVKTQAEYLYVSGTGTNENHVSGRFFGTVSSTLNIYNDGGEENTFNCWCENGADTLIASAGTNGKIDGRDAMRVPNRGVTSALNMTGQRDGTIIYVPDNSGGGRLAMYLSGVPYTITLGSAVTL